MDLFQSKDYLIHWWSGDLEEYYKYMWLEVSQANKVFKIGLYCIGLAAVFDIVKYRDVISNARGTYCKITFGYKVMRKLLSFIDICARLAFIPAYYITSINDKSPRLSLAELWQFIITYHFYESVNEARTATSRKWVNYGWNDTH